MLEGDESTFQQQKHYPNKIMKPAKEEWDQLDLRLANYAQNSDQMLLLKMSGRHVRPWTGYVQFWWIYQVIEPDMSGLPRNFLLNFDF